MAHGTREKIMDSALKEFAEKGYARAKTKDIAERSGLSEMTLFRRFKTKKNLFNQVLEENHQKLMGDIFSIMDKSKIENSDDFIETLIRLLLNLTEENFEYVSLVILERESLSGEIVADVMNYLAEFIDKVSPKSQIDPKVLAFSILSFVYMIILDKKYNHTFIDHEQAIREFIRYSTKCIQSN